MWKTEVRWTKFSCLVNYFNSKLPHQKLHLVRTACIAAPRLIRNYVPAKIIDSHGGRVVDSLQTCFIMKYYKRLSLGKFSGNIRIRSTAWTTKKLLAQGFFWENSTVFTIEKTQFIMLEETFKLQCQIARRHEAKIFLRYQFVMFAACHCCTPIKFSNLLTSCGFD